MTRMAVDVAQVPGPEISTGKWLCGFANGKGAKKARKPTAAESKKTV